MSCEIRECTATDLAAIDPKWKNREFEWNWSACHEWGSSQPGSFFDGLFSSDGATTSNLEGAIWCRDNWRSRINPKNICIYIELLEEAPRKTGKSGIPIGSALLALAVGLSFFRGHDGRTALHSVDSARARKLYRETAKMRSFGPDRVASSLDWTARFDHAGLEYFEMDNDAAKAFIGEERQKIFEQLKTSEDVYGKR